MKMVMRPRYYCEFCGKANGNPAFMRKHEIGCTNRPDRRCRMCEQGETRQPTIDALLAAAGTLEGLRQVAHGCPACMLAAIRQTKWPVIEYEDDQGRFQGSHQERPEDIQGWSFKDACTAFWKDVNAREYDRGAGLY